MSIESVMLSNHLILCHPLFLLPSIFPSIRVFSSKLALHIRYWTFCFSISPSNEYSGLISFRIDWFDLLMVLLSHPYMTTGKTIALISFDLHWALSKWKKGYSPIPSPTQAQPKMPRKKSPIPFTWLRASHSQPRGSACGGLVSITWILPGNIPGGRNT